MAVILQRNLQRRQSLRLANPRGQTWEPKTLDDMCEGLLWQDVKDVVQYLLVDNKNRTMRMLS